MSLGGTHPQSIALILLIRTEHTAEHSAEAYGKQMMVVVVDSGIRIGTGVISSPNVTSVSVGPLGGK